MKTQRKIGIFYAFFLVGFASLVQSGNDDNTVCSLIGEREAQACIQQETCKNSQNICPKLGKHACFDCCFNLYQHRATETENLTETGLLQLKNAVVECGQTCFTGKKPSELRKTSSPAG